MSNRIWTVALLVATSSCGGEPDPLCTTAEVQAALAAAAPGSTVSIGACRLEGSFTVPAGVVVQGSGPTATVISTPSGTAFTLTPGSQPACVKGLRIELAGGPSGIDASGEGNVCVEDVAVNVAVGDGIVVRDATSVAISRVTLTGPINATNSASVPMVPTATTSAPHGIALLRVENATLTDVNASGFAASAVLLFETNTTWTRGTIVENLNVGVFVRRGSAMLEDLEVSRIFRNFTTFFSYAVVCTDGATIATRNLRAEDNGGPGIFQDACDGTHESVEINDNETTGVFAQFGGSIELSGSIQRNKRAGLIAHHTNRTRVTDAAIGGTIATMTISHAGEPPTTIGDGIHLVGAATDLVVSNVMLDGNERIGILHDLDGGQAMPVQFSNVTVSGMGMSLGAIAQRGTVPMDWDTGIARMGATTANDAAFTGELPTVGIVGPCDYPRGDR